MTPTPTPIFDLSIESAQRDIIFARAAEECTNAIIISVTVHLSSLDPNALGVSTNVQFWDGDPQAGGKKLGESRIGSLLVNPGYATASLLWPRAESGRSIYVVLDPDNEVRETDEGNNTASNTFTRHSPTIGGFSATYNGLSGDKIGTFVSLKGSAVIVSNTITAAISDVDGDVERVRFKLGGLAQTDTDGNDGWSGAFNMSSLDAGIHTLEITACDAYGLTGSPKNIFVYVVPKPTWLTQTWVLNPRVTWNATPAAYAFTGIIPNNPRLNYQNDLEIPYLGSLRNRFESDVHIKQTFALSGEWTAEATGVLKAEVLSQSLVDHSFTLTPHFIYNAASKSSEFSYFDFTSPTWTYEGEPVTVYEGTVARFFVGPVEFEVSISVDFGLNASLVIRGRILADMTIDQIRIVPGLTPYISIDISLDIFAGVASIGSEIATEFNFYLPIVYDSTPPRGKPVLYPDNPCLVLDLTATFYVEVLWGTGHWETDPYELASWSWPEGCGNFCPVLSSARRVAGQDQHLMAAPSVAADGAGHALAVWVHDTDPAPNHVDPEISYATWDGNAWATARPLTENERFETDPRVAFLGVNRAIAVWTQNNLTESEALQVADLDDALAHQDIYYSLWDGAAWSEPAAIIADGESDGRAALAAANGKAIAVWVHDADGKTATKGDWEIYYSIFDGTGWSLPTTIAPDETSADAQPAVAFGRQGRALAAWVKDHDDDFTTNDDRRVAYAVWNGVAWSAAIEEGEWPTGVLWPAVVLDSKDNPLLVFTAKGNDPSGRPYGLGTKDMLWSAYLRDGVWQVQPVGVNTAAHQPRLAVNAANYAVVGYRGFVGRGEPGFSGEIAAAVADLNRDHLEWSSPAFLTSDSQRQWQLDLAIEPTSGAVHIVNVGETVGSQAAAARLPGLRRLSSLPGDDVVALRLLFGGDLSIAGTDVALSDPHPSPGEAVEITATVRSSGLRGVDGPVVVGFYLDSRGIELMRVVLPGPLPYNSSAQAKLTWASDGAPHRIIVVVDPEGSITELDEANNEAGVDLGVPPPPRHLVAFGDPRGEAVHLVWQAPETHGIAEYAILRGLTTGGPYEEVGTADSTAYRDSGLMNGQEYYYVVTARDAYGTESAYSEEAAAIPARNVVYPLYLPLLVSSR